MKQTKKNAHLVKYNFQAIGTVLGFWNTLVPRRRFWHQN